MSRSKKSSSHTIDIQSVADGVSRRVKLDYISSISVDLGVKITGANYCSLLL